MFSNTKLGKISKGGIKKDIRMCDRRQKHR